MTNRRLVPAIVICALLSACTGASPGGRATPSAPIPLPSSPLALPLTDPAGYRTVLAGLRGTPVVVNVWASWCDPCKTEAPLLRQAAAAQPQVQFIGVDVQDSKDGAVGFIHRYGIPYPSLFDPSGAIKNGLDLIGQPDTLFYDANGVLRASVLGQIDRAGLDANLAKIAS